MGLPAPLWSTVKIYDFGNGAQMTAVRKSERNANDERVTANHSERERKRSMRLGICVPYTNRIDRGCTHRYGG